MCYCRLSSCMKCYDRLLKRRFRAMMKWKHKLVQTLYKEDQWLEN